MADYDVAVTELSSPPPSAVKTTYRPAVRIRNNGIHDALASGILRIYSAGRLIFTTEIYSAVIPPKETREAQAVNYWTPETEGSYLVIADATCPLDQVETNNHLSPTTVIVGPGEVPVPPVVTQHAAQHEEGGTDQISIDGLRGEAYDPQPPKDHVSRHEQGGSDELSVGGLHGQLADAQPTEDHGNEHHTQTFETVAGCLAQIGTHNGTTAPHPGSTNLEYVSRKGQPNGYASLNAAALVPHGQLDGYSAAAAKEATAYDALPNNSTTTIIEHSFPANYFQTGSRITIGARILYKTAAPSAPTFLVDVKEGAGAYSNIVTLSPPIDTHAPDNYVSIDFESTIPGFEQNGALRLVPSSRVIALKWSGGIAAASCDPLNADVLTTSAISLRLRVVIPNTPGSSGLFHFATIDTADQPSQ